MSMPRSNSRSSTFRSESGKRTYIKTTNWITSGEESNQRNGLSGLAMLIDQGRGPFWAKPNFGPTRPSVTSKNCGPTGHHDQPEGDPLLNPAEYELEFSLQTFSSSIAVA